MTKSDGKISISEDTDTAEENSRIQTISYFILAILGFSFWFFMAVPFASHRESYEWLGMVSSQPFWVAFTFISKTYRPFAQGLTWIAFVILDPRIFPTSVIRQTLLQGLIYAQFVFAWWLIYRTTTERRLFTIIACISGLVFFSGYLQLFHFYGLFYGAVVLTLGALLRFHGTGTFARREVWFAIVALALAFWHPYATALFGAFYFGFYLDTFWQRNKPQHVQAGVILGTCMAAVAGLVIVFPTRAETITLGTRLSGTLISYQTNEVHWIASLVALTFTQLVVLSTRLSPRSKAVAMLFTTVLSVAFYLNGLPVLIIWLCAILIKLIGMRTWSLFFLMLAATLFPFGGAIGSPIYGLFAIIVAVYVTSLDWIKAEKALSFFTPRYAIGVIAVSILVLLTIRAGTELPILTRLAQPLLAERERTYQLEKMLAWLHNSDFCGSDIDFLQDAGNPVDSVQNALARNNRPPSAIHDVRIFWKADLQCQDSTKSPGTAIIAFGESGPAGSTSVFEVKGRYAEDAAVWIENSQK